MDGGEQVRHLPVLHLGAFCESQELLDGATSHLEDLL